MYIAKQGLPGKNFALRRPPYNVGGNITREQDVVEGVVIV